MLKTIFAYFASILLLPTVISITASLFSVFIYRLLYFNIKRIFIGSLIGFLYGTLHVIYIRLIFHFLSLETTFWVYLLACLASTFNNLNRVGSTDESYGKILGRDQDHEVGHTWGYVGGFVNLYLFLELGI